MRILFCTLTVFCFLMHSCTRSVVDETLIKEDASLAKAAASSIKLTFNTEENLNLLRNSNVYIFASEEQKVILEEKIKNMLAGVNISSMKAREMMLISGDSCTPQTTNVATCEEAVALIGECPGDLVYSTESCSCKTPAEEPNNSIKCFTLFTYEGTSGQTIIKSVGGAWALGISGPKWCDLPGCYFE